MTEDNKQFLKNIGMPHSIAIGIYTFKCCTQVKYKSTRTYGMPLTYFSDFSHTWILINKVLKIKS